MPPCRRCWNHLATTGPAQSDDENSAAAGREINVPALFQIVVECQSEDEQRELHDRLVAEGHKCRVLTL